MFNIAVMQTFSELFHESVYKNRTHNYVLTLKKILSKANVKLISNRSNDNFNSLYSVGIFICIDDTCHCSDNF